MRHGKVFALALATGWVTMTVALAIDPTVVTLGTATPGGGFPIYGDAFVAAITAADPTLDVQPRDTKAAPKTCRCSKLANSTSRLFRVKARMRPCMALADPNQSFAS